MKQVNYSYEYSAYSECNRRRLLLSTRYSPSSFPLACYYHAICWAQQKKNRTWVVLKNVMSNKCHISLQSSSLPLPQVIHSLLQTVWNSVSNNFIHIFLGYVCMRVLTYMLHSFTKPPRSIFLDSGVIILGTVAQVHMTRDIWHLLKQKQQQETFHIESFILKPTLIDSQCLWFHTSIRALEGFLILLCFVTVRNQFREFSLLYELKQSVRKPSQYVLLGEIVKQF